MQTGTKILIVGPSWVGDMVMAQSLFITLKQRFSNCHIDVLAPSWSLSLLERMPEVSDAIASPFKHGQFDLSGRIKLGRQLRSNNYDRTILLPNSWKSALTPFFADIPIRTGFIGEARWGLLNDIRQLDKSRLGMTVQRFVALGLQNNEPLPSELPIPSLRIEPQKQQAVIEKFGLKPSANILALCPGAEYGPAKRWPSSYFAEVANNKIDQGWQVWLFGSEKDRIAADEINRDTSGLCTDFTGRTTLAEAVDLMSLVNTVVTNDSGLMHVAAALNKNLIAIYGSSDPGFTPPLSDKAKIVSLHLDCSPCFKRECPLGHTKCLNDISPDQIFKLI